MLLVTLTVPLLSVSAITSKGCEILSCCLSLSYHQLPHENCESSHRLASLRCVELWRHYPSQKKTTLGTSITSQWHPISLVCQKRLWIAVYCIEFQVARLKTRHLSKAQTLLVFKTIKSITTAHIFSPLICDLLGKSVEWALTMDHRSYSQFSRLWSHCEESLKANKDCRVRYCRHLAKQTRCTYTYYIEQTSSQEVYEETLMGLQQV